MLATWLVGLSLECGYLPSGTPLEKAFSSKGEVDSPSLVVTFGISGSCSLPHFSAGVWSGLNLCRSCACCHSLCEFIHASVLLCLEDTVYSEPSTTSGSWVFLPPLLYTLLSLEGGIWWRQSIWNWVLQNLSHCTRCFCEFLYRFPSNVGRSFSDDGWAIHWPDSFTLFFFF